MKRMILSLLIVFIALGVAFAEDLTPKNVACEAACKKTLDDCKDKAKGNKLKEAGCKKAHEKCLKDCKAEKKDCDKKK